MTAPATNANSLLDGFLPDWHFRRTYEIRINAAPSVVYERLLVTDLHSPWIVRLLLSLRTGRWMKCCRPAGGLRESFEGSGFVILDEVPGEEIVVGVAGKFWRPDGGRYLDLRAADFVGFSRPGYAKAAMNFRLRAGPPEVSSSGKAGGKGVATVLSTETRIWCCDRRALWRFRLYWVVVESFSGVIRKAILKQVKAEVEGSQQE